MPKMTAVVPGPTAPPRIARELHELNDRVLDLSREMRDLRREMERRR